MPTAAPIALLIATVAAPPAYTNAPAVPGPAVGDWITFKFQSPAGTRHDARLWRPAPDQANGVSVLVLGGGAVTDMHWTISGSYTIDGKTTRVTIDNTPTRDADTIAESLVRAGFTVMQWSSIHDADPQYPHTPALAMGITYPESVELARAALAALRDQPGVDDNRIALVGHSLGATRACHIADDGVVAMAFLSGAYLSKVAGQPSKLTADVWSELAADPGADAALDPAEFAAWRLASTDAPLAPPFEQHDRDGDGLLRAWELAASLRLARLEHDDPAALDDRPTFRHGLPWPADILAARATPALALYGGLDPISVHGPILDRADIPRVEVTYLPQLNHQLAPDENSLTGPIAPEPVRLLTRWLTQACAPDSAP